VTIDGRPISLAPDENFSWKYFFEPFGRDAYWMGPEYKSTIPAGTYEIYVTSPNNDSKYSLAIGEAEAFGVVEGYNAVRLIPELKRNFFNESPAGFILAPFGYGYIIAIFLLSFVFGFLYRLIMRRVAKGPRAMGRNIGKSDRALRAVLGLALFILAVTTTWNPLLLFFAGFCLFESLFSWCGLYAALGKNSCPIR
jgi:hypothetical protein